MLLALIALGIAALVRLQWVGYLEADDLLYAQAATGYLEHGSYLPISHWGLRHAIVWPMALAFALFGKSEATLTFVGPAYLAALLALVVAAAWRGAGPRAAVLALAFAGLSPMLANSAGYVTDDLPEALFIVMSLLAWLRAIRAPGASWLIASGAAAALAFLTRETAAALLVFYVGAFLLGHGPPRRRQFWMLAGFLPIYGLDWLILWVASGDPLYRFHIALLGVAGDGPQMAPTTGERDHTLIPLPRLIEPLLMPFFHQSFGLFAWIAAPAALAGALRLPAGVTRTAIRALLAFAAVWMLVNFYLLSSFLWLIARYMAVLIPTLALAAALALDALHPVHLPRRVMAAICLLFLSSLTIAGSRDGGLLFGERALAAYAATVTQPIMTDPGTYRGARWLLEREGAAGRVSAGPPRPGTIWFANGQPRRPDPGPPVGIGPTWRKLATFNAAPPPVWRLLRASGLAGLLPARLRSQILAPPREATAWLVPPA